MFLVSLDLNCENTKFDLFREFINSPLQSKFLRTLEHKNIRLLVIVRGGINYISLILIISFFCLDKWFPRRDIRQRDFHWRGFPQRLW